MSSHPLSHHRVRSAAGIPRLRRFWILVAAGLAVFLLVGWQGVTTVARSGPLDAGEYLLNAQYLNEHGHLPPAAVSYEYSAPPLYEVVAVGAERTVHWLPSVPLELGPNWLTRGLWLALTLLSVAAMTASRPRLRAAGLGGLALAVLWGLDEAISLGKTEPWSAGQLVALLAGAALVGITALIAREVWPEHPNRMFAAAGFAVAYPVVLRLGMLFHPETTTALLGALTILLVLRARRQGWPWRLGIALGVVCALGILTRQSLVVVALCALLVGLVAGGREARRFTLATAVVLIVLAGPWLIYALHAWGNPLQGNLDRRGDMLSGEPLSFFVSFPLHSLLAHPYRPWFANQFLPQLHADLWSDWYGGLHSFWGSSSGTAAVAPGSHADRLTASSQSILGFAGDALGLFGLLAYGVPGLVRLLRRRQQPASEFAMGVLALIIIAGIAGLLAQVLRYPQMQGKEVKASYLMFAAPCWAVFAVAAWARLSRARTWVSLVLITLAGAYAISYGAHLAAAFDHHYDPELNLVEGEGYVNLQVSLQANTAAYFPGKEADFAVFVANNGTETADDVVLRIELDPRMHLLGAPYFERGSGCTGTSELICSLSFLPAKASTPIRLGVLLGPTSADEAITASVSAREIDLHPGDDSTTTTLHLHPAG